MEPVAARKAHNGSVSASSSLPTRASLVRFGHRGLRVIVFSDDFLPSHDMALRSWTSVFPHAEWRSRDRIFQSVLSDLCATDLEGRCPPGMWIVPSPLLA